MIETWINEDRLCRFCERTASNTFVVPACCGAHNLRKEDTPPLFLEHSHHCDRREAARHKLTTVPDLCYVCPVSNQSRRRTS